MGELKKRMGMINHQIDQLKEEVSYKDACIIKEHLENQRLEKDKEALKVSCSAVQLVLLGFYHLNTRHIHKTLIHPPRRIGEGGYQRLLIIC